MTILNRQIADIYSNFRTAMEDAPQGTFQKTRDLFALINTIMEDMMTTASVHGFRTDNTDRCYETEALIFDYLRYSNPILDNEIKLALALGKKLNSVGQRERERILSGLERDHRFLADEGMMSIKFGGGE